MNRAADARWSFLPAVAAALLLAAAAPGSEYLHEDARIEGRQIHSFTEAGEQVCVVLGDFSLTVGKHQVAGRDAVVWIRTRKAGELGYHNLTAYVEGDAHVAEPGGATTSDRVMLVSLRSFGRLTAEGNMSDRPLTDFPLYRRAVEARRAAREGAGAEASPAGAPPGAGAVPPAASRPAASMPAGPAGRGGAPEAAIRVTRPRPPRRVDPVDFHARQVTSQEVTVAGQKQRLVIARGEVYLSQGSAQAENFLEMRARDAVVFVEPKPARQAGVPWAPAIRGVKLPGGGEEAVTGAYLEGDVVIGRGERSLRAPAAFYDFTASQALIVEPVFRTVQEQREIPIYIRAKEARAISEREMVFKDAEISTSEFYTPFYSIGAKRAYLKNTTPYDEKGVRLGERSWLAEMTDVTYNLQGVPLAWMPEVKTEFEEGPIPLRKASIGQHGVLGFGGQTQWHLFRLLGLLRPKGFDATLDLDWYERGPFAGINLEYDRDTFSGYADIHGLIDQEKEDDFGEERKNIDAPLQRGRILARHKQFLPGDWTLQFELSYICDRNFLEEFFPDEAYAGKEQETLLYAKKQQDNWAFTLLGKYRLNRFQDQTEAAPDAAFYLIGQPLARDVLTFFNETHAGLLRQRLPDYVTDEHRDFLGRLDTRNEVDLPLHLGPVNLTPYAVGRATYWSDEPEEDGKNCRLYGQVGTRANMHIWRVFPDVRSRVWDLQGLKHVITPEVVAFVSCAGGVRPTRPFPWDQFVDVKPKYWDLTGLRYGYSPEVYSALAGAGRGVHDPQPGNLFPLDPGIEEDIGRQSGVELAVSQRLQTKRGPADNLRTVDWMRLDLSLGIYDNGSPFYPAGGRFDFYRPEYSIARNHLNADYTWNISDSTSLLADMNWDLNSGNIRIWDIGLAVTRDPRLRYYLGFRRIADLDSGVATVAASYRINEKYTVSFMEQFDTDYSGQKNLGTSVTLVRKFPRWYLATTFVLDSRTDRIGLFFTVWPEGVPEFRIGSNRMALLSESSLN